VSKRTTQREVGNGEPAEKIPGDVETESFGTWLRRQREGREIDLREIADTSKIGLTYLQAFEDDRFDLLPAPVFAKGFLRQYARYVGLDPEEVVNFYLAASGNAGTPEEVDEPQEEEVAPRSDRRSGWLIAALGVLLAGLIWWLLGSAGPEAESTTAGTPAVPEAASPGPGSPDAGRPDPGSPDPGRPDPGSPDAGRPDAGRPDPGRPDPGSPDPGATETAARRAPLRVTLDFGGECWVEAAVDGEPRVSEIKVQGESLMLDAEEYVELKVGNVDVVEVEVNGRPFRFPRISGTPVRTQRIDLETLEALAGVAPGEGAGR